jgi:hypothetical protein
MIIHQVSEAPLSGEPVVPETESAEVRKQKGPL